ncbi:hypothetical protein FPQ18DRAFT_407262, partial [Pyronema domesticum]
LHRYLSLSLAHRYRLLIAIDYFFFDTYLLFATMVKRSYDEFASDYDLKFNFGQECECILCFQADKEESNLSNCDLALGPLRKHVCAGLSPKMGLEDPDHDDLSHQHYEEYDLFHQKFEEQNFSYHYYQEHDHNLSDQYDYDYDSSYQYYEQEEEEQGMPDFECEEDMHHWMLKNAEDIHRTALFKDVGNQYPVWLKCDEEKALDGGLMKAMMMASNLCGNTFECDFHD